VKTYAPPTFFPVFIDTPPITEWRYATYGRDDTNIVHGRPLEISRLTLLSAIRPHVSDLEHF